MQQLSGSSGRGGTSTPAMRVEAASRRARAAGPARRDPKTTLARAAVAALVEADLGVVLVVVDELGCEEVVVLGVGKGFERRRL